MSSDEDDYMSDKFLENAEKVAPAAPLLARNSDKRALEILKRKKEIEEKLKQKKKSMKVVEKEKREEGLSCAISSDNKGFAMLAKMGYKPGQGIGKNETGISEPISINVKDGKSGLGKETKLKEYREKMKKHKEERFNPNEFRSRMSNKVADLLVKRDLAKSQRICQQLDTRSDVKEPMEIWFWPKIDAEIINISDSDEEKDEEEKEKDDDDDDKDSDDNEEDKVKEIEEKEKEKKENIEDEEDDGMTPNEKLPVITKYLRDKYYYCIWCGIEYTSDIELKDSCPGSTRNDH